MQSLILPIALAATAALLPAQTLTYGVGLGGGEEVPANNSAGQGQASITIDMQTGSYQVTGSYSNLSGNASASHIHGPGRRGLNGGLIAGLTISGGTSGRISGSGTLTAAQRQTLQDGMAYLNVHTGAFPGGELRGQIDQVPGSGSANAAGMQITGAATTGSTLNLACAPLTGLSVILIGGALPAGVVLPLPGALGCSPAGVGVDITQPFAAIPGSSLSVRVPPTPDVHVAAQCISVAAGRTCIDLSAAHRIAIRR